MYNLKLLPLKFRVYQYLGESKKPLTEDEIYEALRPEYGGEAQFTRDRISTYLISMMATGQAEELGVGLNEVGELQIQYGLTDLGKSRLKQLPHNHNEAAY